MISTAIILHYFFKMEEGPRKVLPQIELRGLPESRAVPAQPALGQVELGGTLQVHAALVPHGVLVEVLMKDTVRKSRK